MITKVEYAKIISEFEFLKFFPSDKNKIISAYNSLAHAKITEKEDLFRAFSLWVKNHDTFPSHIELRNMLIPAMKEYSIDQIMTCNAENIDLFYIQNWMEENCDIFRRPILCSFDQAHVTIVQENEWSKQEQISDNIAMKRFKTYFKENPTEYKKLLNGELNNAKLEIEDKSDDYGIDYGSIGKIE